MLCPFLCGESYSIGVIVFFKRRKIIHWGCTCSVWLYFAVFDGCFGLLIMSEELDAAVGGEWMVHVGWT